MSITMHSDAQPTAERNTHRFANRPTATGQLVAGLLAPAQLRAVLFVKS